MHTVDSFQGSEASVVIVSLVRSNGGGGRGGGGASIGFLGDGRRLNVAITRAKDLLIIVGDCNTFDSMNSQAITTASSGDRKKGEVGKQCAAVALYQDALRRGYIKSETAMTATLSSMIAK